MIFDENIQKRSLEIGGPFRRPIGNSEKMKCERVQQNQGFASSRAGADESDFESSTSANSIIPAATKGIIIHSAENSKGFFDFFTTFLVAVRELCGDRVENLQVGD